MILTGQQIVSEVALRRITIDPFLTENVNPNSYNFRVSESLRVYRDHVIDPRTRPATKLVTMPESGYSRTAKVYETLSDHRAAAEQYALAATSRPAGTYARIVALDLVASAEMHLNPAASSRRALPGAVHWTT